MVNSSKNDSLYFSCIFIKIRPSIVRDKQHFWRLKNNCATVHRQRLPVIVIDDMNGLLFVLSLELLKYIMIFIQIGVMWKKIWMKYIMSNFQSDIKV